jgi:hypothetical protein
LLKEWLRAYLEQSRRKNSKKTVTEKEMVLCDFSQFCVTEGIDSIEKLTPAKVQGFLAPIFDARGPGVANRYLKNLKTAWTWGTEDGIDDFPVILGSSIRSAVDQRAILELLRLKGDLGRLGGLLKMALRDGQLGHSKRADTFLEELEALKSTIASKVDDLRSRP